MDEQRLLDLYIRESFYKSSSHSDVARFLRAGNDINATDDNGNNALFQCRTPEAMASLISNGINIHHINDAGQHALFHQQDPELLERLISLGLDLKQTDIHGRNCIYGHFSSPESLELLLNAGCDINHRDNLGNTLLHLPVSPEVLSMGINRGCDVNIINHAGEGIIESFRSDEYFEIILSHIDKFRKRTLHIDFCNYQSVVFLFDLYELGFRIELNKKHVIINSHVGDYKDILLMLNYISEIRDVKFYTIKRRPLYKGINKEIVKWMIRNDFHVDLTKTEGDKYHDDLVAYKTQYEQRELSKALKSNKGWPAITKNSGRL
ncbi:ankyrin repeat domain-containing protein [Salmonella enterica subsp. enterica serovar Enteritidis]|nr:ankyrin repeat domain-containing protein [Salmonella enterica subsp. enterica serovar Enteritidis]